MSIVLALLFTAFGVPLLTVALFTGYEIVSYCRKNAKKTPVDKVPTSVKFQGEID